MLTDDIKDEQLRELFHDLKYSSFTIECDALDALNDSSSDEELVLNFYNKLDSLRDEAGGLQAVLRRIQENKKNNAEES